MYVIGDIVKIYRLCLFYFDIRKYNIVFFFFLNPFFPTKSLIYIFNNMIMWNENQYCVSVDIYCNIGWAFYDLYFIIKYIIQRITVYGIYKFS